MYPYIQTHEKFKEIRKTRDITYALTENPHKTKEYDRGAERMTFEGLVRCIILGNRAHHTVGTNSSNSFKCKPMKQPPKYACR